MKKLILLILCSELSFLAPAWADTNCASVLPQVSLQLTAEQWVTTQTARVSVSLDALLNKNQLAKAQENFQAALKRIAPEGVWHITEFSRAPSKTNLEQLHAMAEARLSDNALAGLRERASAQNGEGQTYIVQDIIYSPTTDEISNAYAQLRAQIYNQTKAELDRLNAVYPKAGYGLYNINFTSVNIQPGPIMMKIAGEMNAAARETGNVSLSQKLTQDAVVVLAAPPGALCNSQKSP